MRISKAHWPELEIFKGLGIFLMLLVHGSIWLIPYSVFQETKEEFWPELIRCVLYLGFIPLLLPATAGSTLRLALVEPFSGRTQKAFRVSRSVFILGSALLASGYILNYFSFPTEQILHWDALQFLGLCFIFIIPLLFCPPPLLLVFSLLVLAATPTARILFAESTSFWVIALVGKSYTNWPIFPWFSVFVYGYWVAEMRFRYSNRVLLKPSFVGLNLLMVMVGNTYGILAYLSQLKLWGNSVFHLPIPLVISLLGGYGLTLSLLEVSSAKFPRFHLFTHFLLDPFSRGSFWIFILHVIFGYRTALWLTSRGIGDLRFPLFILPLLIGAWILGRILIYLGSKRLRFTFVKWPLSKPEPQS